MCSVCTHTVISESYRACTDIIFFYSRRREDYGNTILAMPDTLTGCVSRLNKFGFLVNFNKQLSRAYANIILNLFMILGKYIDAYFNSSV